MVDVPLFSSVREIVTWLAGKEYPAEISLPFSSVVSSAKYSTESSPRYSVTNASSGVYAGERRSRRDRNGERVHGFFSVNARFHRVMDLERRGKPRLNARLRAHEGEELLVVEVLFDLRAYFVAVVLRVYVDAVNVVRDGFVDYPARGQFRRLVREYGHHIDVAHEHGALHRVRFAGVSCVRLVRVRQRQGGAHCGVRAGAWEMLPFALSVTAGAICSAT